MEIITSIAEIRGKLAAYYRTGKAVHFIPTMGALHKGHLALIRAAKANNTIRVVSIFVNPKQFGAGEDFESYPRDLVADSHLLALEGVEFLFAPSTQEMWPDGTETFVDCEHLSGILQGALRPGHFCGVLTVVAKLFNIIQPKKAFFGEKDFQQLTIIRRMVKDLAFPVEIVGVPILRESDGVAASSRNVFLTPPQREGARLLAKALEEAEQAFQKGERDVSHLKDLMANILAQTKEAEIEEIAILNAETLSPLELISKEAVILLTVKFGKVRLLDQKFLKEVKL